MKISGQNMMGCFKNKNLIINIHLSLTGNAACPVESFLKYLSKLHPECEDLWQRPKDSSCPDDLSWFCKAPLGKNTLSSMMATISKQGQLSQRYTNHCIRSTAITILDAAGLICYFLYF